MKYMLADGFRVLFMLILCRIVYPKRGLSNRVYASDEARESAIQKAEKLESTLEGDHPSFIRSMLPSHVTGGFWLVSITPFSISLFCFWFFLVVV